MAREAILLLEHDPATARALTDVLQQEAFQVYPVDRVDMLQKAMERMSFPAVMIDVNFPGVNPLQLISGIAAAHPNSAIVCLGAELNAAAVLSVFRAGAHEIVFKPCEPVDLLARVRVGLDAAAARMAAASGQSDAMATEQLAQANVAIQQANQQVANMQAAMQQAKQLNLNMQQRVQAAEEQAKAAVARAQGAEAEAEAAKAAAAARPKPPPPPPAKRSASLGPALAEAGDDARPLFAFAQTALDTFLRLEKEVQALQRKVQDFEDPAGSANRERALRTLVAHSDASFVAGIQSLAAKLKLELGPAVSTGGEVFDKVGTFSPDLVILDEHFPDIPGDMIAETVRSQHPGTGVLVMRGIGGPSMSVEVGFGADRHTRDLVNLDDFVEVLEQCKERCFDADLARDFWDEFKSTHDDFVSKYTEIKRVFGK